MRLILFLIICLKYCLSEYSANQTYFERKLIFNIYQKDIHYTSLENVISAPNAISYTDCPVLVNTSNDKSFVGSIDYSLSSNILFWRVIGAQNGLYVTPLNKR